MVIYFSGTGNSRFCAEYIAARLDDEAIDAANYIREGIAAELICGRPWVFVAPTYAWQMPWVFRDFLRRSWLQGSREAYFVLTCGGDIGAAGEKLDILCRETALRYRGVCEVRMPENYIAMFPVPDEDASRRIVEAAKPVLDTAVDLIRRNENFPAKKLGVFDRFKTRTINRGFYQYAIKTDKFYATDACVGCGKCAELCVYRNITIIDGKPAWGAQCTHCMACICRCPTAAIEYGRISLGKRRYICPTEMVREQE